MPPSRHTPEDVLWIRKAITRASASSRGAAPEAITAAWRREARLVHPDVPETGDAAAFLELKQAYDVLIHADRRAAYDRSARQRGARNGRRPRQGTWAGEPGRSARRRFPRWPLRRTRHPRLRDLPTAVWAGMAVVLMVGVVEVGLHLTSSPTQDAREPIPATAPDVPPLAPNEPGSAPYGPAPVRLAGTPNFYIVPTASPAMLWRVDEARHTLVPWGQLPPFSAVQALRLLKPSGMVEVKVTDSANGYVEAGRLTPGDVAAAARAWCTYNAGPTPANGEVLSHAGKGRGRLSIDNRSGPTGGGENPLRRRCRHRQRVPGPRRRDDDGGAAGRAGAGRIRHRRGVEPRLPWFRRRHAGAASAWTGIARHGAAAGDPARCRGRYGRSADQAFEQE